MEQKMNSPQPLTDGEMIEIDLAGYAKKLEAEERRIFDYRPKINALILNMKYPYEIDLNRIPGKAALLSWVLHLNGKTWMKKRHLSMFIRKVCEIKGWNPYSEDEACH